MLLLSVLLLLFLVSVVFCVWMSINLHVFMCVCVSGWMPLILSPSLFYNKVSRKKRKAISDPTKYYKCKQCDNTLCHVCHNVFQDNALKQEDKSKLSNCCLDWAPNEIESLKQYFRSGVLQANCKVCDAHHC